MNSRKLKVLALVEAQVVTAPAKILLNFARDCRDSVELTLVTFVRAGESSTGAPSRNAFIAAAAQAGIPLETVPEAGRFDRTAITHLRRLCAQYRPDIVQTNSVKSHFLVSLLRPRDFGWIAFHHGYTAEDLKMRLYNQLDRFSLRACDRVVTVCEAFANQLRQRGVPREKISVIPNGIATDFIERDEAEVRAGRARFGVSADEALVLSIGRLSPEKGHRFLIDAAARLKQNRNAPACKILIAGSGLLEAKLAAQIKAAGVENFVQLIGHQSDVRPLFQMADLFVLPSLSEGSPMVLLESMAAHVPVVTTNVGGIPEAVTHDESALLVSPASPEPLADAIAALLQDRRRAARIAEAAFLRVRDHFSPSLYNQRVLASYQAVIAARASRQVGVSAAS